MSSSLFVTFPAGTSDDLIAYLCTEILTWGQVDFKRAEVLSTETQDDGTLVVHATADRCQEYWARAIADKLSAQRNILGWQLLV